MSFGQELGQDSRAEVLEMIRLALIKLSIVTGRLQLETDCSGTTGFSLVARAMMYAATTVPAAVMNAENTDPSNPVKI